VGSARRSDPAKCHVKSCNVNSARHAGFQGLGITLNISDREDLGTLAVIKCLLPDESLYQISTLPFHRKPVVTVPMVTPSESGAAWPSHRVLSPCSLCPEIRIVPPPGGATNSICTPLVGNTPIFCTFRYFKLSFSQRCAGDRPGFLDSFIFKPAP